MNESYTYLKNYISKHVALSDEDINLVLNASQEKKFKREESIIRCNELCQNAYFLIKGSVQYSIKNIKNEKVIYTFRFEEKIVLAYSLYNNNIAKFDVNAIEDCTIISIPILSILELSEKSIAFEKFKFALTQTHLLELVNYVTDSISKTVLERYNDLELNFPNINQRIPQYLIANYLGVSQEHFSRLKKSRNINTATSLNKSLIAK
jgi:CRP-like cAMP-binding protein